RVLKELNPDISIEELNSPIEKVSRNILKSSNVIVEGLDTFKVRRWVNAFAVTSNIPLVSGGMYGFLGNIQVVIPYKTPCLECQSLIPEKELQKACTPFGEVRKDVRKEVEKEEYIPSVSSVSLVIGGLMAHEALKIINGIPPMSNYLFWDGTSGLFTAVPLERRKDCFVCSKMYHLDVIPIYVSNKQTLREFIQQLRYSFNLGLELKLLFETRNIEISEKLISEELKDGDIFRVIDPSIPTPLKFKLYLK
ncbi:MAG: HesA/MoeB/ThiF family protein, partial [Candidatus Hodarchaeales archaeon]